MKTVSGTSIFFFYDSSSRVLGIGFSTSGTWGLSSGYIYLGRQLEVEHANNTTYFIRPDHLGTTRLVTVVNQSVTENLDYYPFGDLNRNDPLAVPVEFTGDVRG